MNDCNPALIGTKVTDKLGNIWRIDGIEGGKYRAIMFDQWGCQCSWVPFMLSPRMLVAA